MYRVFRKNCVFSQFTAAPSSQRNASVQQLLLDGDFLYNQQQPSAGEGEVANFKEFLEKNTILSEHPVVDETELCGKKNQQQQIQHIIIIHGK